VVLDGPTSSTVPVSPEQSLSTSTTSSTDYSAASSLDNNADSFTSEEDYQIEDSFWSETLAMAVDSSDHSSGMEREDSPAAPAANDEMDFWLKLFMQASDMQNNLPQI
jgi:myb proto-oncogene protein